MVVMFREPTADGLAIMVLEARMIVVSVSVAISVVILGKSAAARERQSQGEKSYSATGKQVSYFHDSLQFSI
jgi:hypothetical protein